MNTNEIDGQIFPADPRVTAYAFGELEGAERELVEAAVKADPALQATVAELRDTGPDEETQARDESHRVGTCAKYGHTERPDGTCAVCGRTL